MVTVDMPCFDLNAEQAVSKTGSQQASFQWLDTSQDGLGNRANNNISLFEYMHFTYVLKCILVKRWYLGYHSY